MRKMKFVSVFVLLALLLSVGPGAVMAQEPLPPQVIVTVSKEAPQPPEDWIVVRDETFERYDERGQQVTFRVVEYREPIIHPLEGSRCNVQGTSGVKSWYCSYWYAGSFHTTATVGGVTEHLYTTFTRYHWLGAGGGSAWYLNYTAVWWTRTSSAWSVGQTHMWIADTRTHKDCNYEDRVYGEYNDYFTPGWNGNTTWAWYYYTSGRGILMAPDIKPRIHQIGPTPVKYYGSNCGTLPEHRHKFYQSGYSS